MNLGPVPGRSAADRPARLGEHSALPPLIHGGTGHAQLRGDLGQSYRLAISHEKSVSKVLTPDQGCSDNQYMTQTQNLTNNETVTIGIVAQADGTYLALTWTASKTFKTYLGAARFLARRGYNEFGEEL
jgi:hypothetical protein